jgi:hypothetical protein
MKSLRLNNQMRTDILNSFVEKYLAANPEPTVVSIDNLQCKLAIQISDKIYSKYKGLVPDDLLNTRRYVKVMLPNESVASYYFGYDEEGNSIYKISTTESKVEYVFTSDDPLWVAHLADLEAAKLVNTAYEEHNKALRKFKSEVKTVLESVNTTGQLVEVWPEALPFVPQNISNPSSINLPSVNFAELNKVLG